MSRKARHHGRGGSTGQHHTKGPADLRDFKVPPAGPVTVTRADGTVEEQPAKAPKVAKPPKRKRPKPARSPEPIPIDRIRPRQVSAARQDPRAVDLAAKRPGSVDHGAGTFGVPSTGIPTKAQQRNARRRPGAMRRPCRACLVAPDVPCRDAAGTALASPHPIR